MVDGASGRRLSGGRKAPRSAGEASWCFCECKERAGKVKGSLSVEKKGGEATHRRRRRTSGDGAMAKEMGRAWVCGVRNLTVEVNGGLYGHEDDRNGRGA